MRAEESNIVYELEIGRPEKYANGCSCSQREGLSYTDQTPSELRVEERG